MSHEQEISFYLDISAEDYLRYYKGQARHVLVTSKNGLRVQFPAAALQRFVTHDGVRGHFVMRYDESLKMTSISKVS